ncbi:MAG: SLBB domain-containing protein [Candidatus Pacebacteria bacterium]|nr:SLBB domain-containing protein [Candidatus Paceibacterota bacterium]
MKTYTTKGVLPNVRTAVRHGACMCAVLCLAGFVQPNTAAADAAAICPGDRLDNRVFEHDNLSSMVQVQQDGRIRVPLCGWVEAAGKRAGELAETLSARYKQANIERAFVTVQITAYGPRTVYVIGEVLEGGKSIEITPPAALTVTQAVSAAGGFKDTADLRHVLVRRTSSSGEVMEIPVDVLAIISGRKKASDPVLQVGDTVVIPRSKPVYVNGEVNTPGVYYVGTHSALRCSEILGKAGGITDTANRTRVMVFRRTQDAGDTDLLEVDMDAVFSGDFAQDIKVLPGDMVVVSRRLKIYVFGEVGTPGAVDLEPGLKLTAFQAITLSGGFTAYAAEGSVLRVRGDKKSVIDLRKPYRKGVENADPELMPGDILFVPGSIW